MVCDIASTSQIQCYQWSRTMPNTQLSLNAAVSSRKQGGATIYKIPWGSTHSARRSRESHGFRRQIAIISRPNRNRTAAIRTGPCKYWHVTQLSPARSVSHLLSISRSQGVCPSVHQTQTHTHTHGTGGGGRRARGDTGSRDDASPAAGAYRQTNGRSAPHRASTKHSRERAQRTLALDRRTGRDGWTLTAHGRPQRMSSE